MIYHKFLSLYFKSKSTNNPNAIIFMNPIRNFIAVISLTAVVCFSSLPNSYAQENPASPSERPAAGYKEVLERTEFAMDLLQEGYAERTGLWRGTGWWNCANVLTATIRYAKYSDKKAEFEPIFANTLVQAARRNRDFLNEFYDDEGWWALAWVEAYELTGEKKYLDQAERIFLDMTTGWSDLHGGGMFWKKNDTYKNSITNNLFTLLALRLHANLPEKEIKGEKYLQWGLKNWKWYSGSGMINRESWMIEDGLRRNDGQPNRNQHWTYNQGVAVAALVELSKIKSEAEKSGQELPEVLDEDFLGMGRNIADATISRLSRNGILRERNEPNCGADGEQFKGVFMRHVFSLYEATKEEKYRDFIVNNAESVWKNRNPETQAFGVSWSVDNTKISTATHSSALEALVAQLGIVRE